MRKYLLSFALLVVATGAVAQTRLLKKAEGLMKLDRYDEAQELVTQALTSGETKDMAMAWNMQGDLYQKAFSEELDKASHHEVLDTARFITNLYATLDAYEKCLEVDEKQEYTEKNKPNLIRFRSLLMYVGQFELQNQNYLGAYKAYEDWLNYPQTYKAVGNEKIILNDTIYNRSQVAYYACLVAYQGKAMDKVGVHLDEALEYKEEAKTVRQLHLMTLLEKGDTAQWVDASKKYALDDEAIAQNLLAYYSDKKDNEASLQFATELIEADPNNKIANYSKGVVLFGQDKFEEALPFFEKSTEVDPEFTDAYYNAGVCCTNMGYAVNEQISAAKNMKKAEYDSKIEEVKDWYKKAEPFFLKVKELDPDNAPRWASRLATVYYITGEKDKEEEMNAYLKE